MTRKIEIPITLAQDLLELCVKHSRYENVSDLSQAIVAIVQSNEKPAAAVASVSKKRVRKAKKAKEAAPNVTINTPALVANSSGETKKKSKAEYMRQRRAAQKLEKAGAK